MQLLKKITVGKLVLLLLFSVAPLTLWAQPAPIPHHREPYHLDSGEHEGLAAETISVFRKVIQVEGVPWLRLHFSNYNLGTRSYITITSELDGSQQRLDAKTMAEWQDSSAYFNGDTVEIELHVAPGEKGIFIHIDEITVGEWAEGEAAESVCGTTDNRVSSTDPREGRIVPVGCTGWIGSNGAFLTAGHCTGPNMSVLEYNVPNSLADGTIVHPGPQDQYAIIPGSVVFNVDGTGIGDDWAVFNVNPNTTTGLTPVQAQNAFFRMSRDYSTSGPTVRITGYGVDGPPPLYGGGDPPGPRNSDSQTLQTHSGPYNGETYEGPSDSYHSYRVDTMGGNSGSPIILDGTLTTIGIHTDGGCTDTGGNNYGTSFENNALENAIQTFPGLNVIYADAGHPVSSSNEDGTVLRPYDTVTEAVKAVTSGGIVSIVSGSYTKAAGNTFLVGEDGKWMTIEAPVGTVYIGN